MAGHHDGSGGAACNACAGRITCCAGISVVRLLAGKQVDSRTEYTRLPSGVPPWASRERWEPLLRVAGARARRTSRRGPGPGRFRSGRGRRPARRRRCAGAASVRDRPVVRISVRPLTEILPSSVSREQIVLWVKWEAGEVCCHQQVGTKSSRERSRRSIRYCGCPSLSTSTSPAAASASANPPAGSSCCGPGQDAAGRCCGCRSPRRPATGRCHRAGARSGQDGQKAARAAHRRRPAPRPAPPAAPRASSKSAKAPLSS